MSPEWVISLKIVSTVYIGINFLATYPLLYFIGGITWYFIWGININIYWYTLSFTASILLLNILVWVLIFMYRNQSTNVRLGLYQCLQSYVPFVLCISVVGSSGS